MLTTAKRARILRLIRRQYDVPAMLGARVYYNGVRCTLVDVALEEHRQSRLLIRDEAGVTFPPLPVESVEWPAIMYRCSACGKWSHNQHRKPKHHARWTTDPVEADRYPSKFEKSTGIDDTDGWWLECGPFNTYEARQDHYADRNRL